MTGPAQNAKISKLAIASLVLGLISFCIFFLTRPLLATSTILGIISLCTFFLTALLAIIFGIISLIMIVTSHGQLKGTGITIAGIIVPTMMLILLWTALTAPSRTSQRIICGSNMSSLSKVMYIYASDHNNTFPTPSKWCDLLIEHTEVSKQEFRYPAKQDGPCNYAMNKNIERLGIYAPPNMVLLFETSPGWNQSGGPEILSTENHQGEGCNFLFNDGHVRFVKTEDLNDLKWTAEQKK